MTTGNALDVDIERMLREQNRWRRVMSGAYFATSAFAIVAAGASTVVSGIGHAAAGSALAGAATILFGIEKAMLFREKWAHHLSTSMQLDALRLELQHGAKSETEVVRELRSILTDYAVKLPIARREQRANPARDAGPVT